MNKKSKLTAKICNQIIAELSDKTLTKYRDTTDKYLYIIECMECYTDYFTNEKNITLFENAMIRACVKRVNTGRMNKNNLESWDSLL